MSVWDAAIWGTDRWPALSIAEMLQAAPNVAHGVPTGIGDWRVSVEVLLPADLLATWGIATWGTSEWPTYVWYDLTYWCRGVEWTRGSDEPYGRPRVGQLSMTLDSRNDEFSPWSSPSEDVGSPGDATPSWWAPGTIVRVGLRSATDTRARGWLPQFCGLVDSWVVDFATSNLADKYATVTAVETLRDLAQVDDNALPSAVGGGEGASERIERLLAAAAWRFGLLIEAQNVSASPTNYPVQSTDMAANRLTECYLVADASDTHFRTDRTGAAILTNIEYLGNVGVADEQLLPLSAFSKLGAQNQPTIVFARVETTNGPGTLKYVAYRPDSFKTSTSDENVVNDCRFARVGGTQQVYEQDASISRYGRRTLVRTDLPNTTDPPVALISEYISVRRALNTLRVDSLVVDIDRCSTDHALSVIAADIQSASFVFPPTSDTPDTEPYFLGYVRNMTHRVTPRNTGEVTWEASFGFDTRTVYNIPGAQLPAT